MTLEKYNNQLLPCARCQSKLVEIVGNKYAVGARCSSCGNFFSVEDPDAPLKEVVEWWNNHYGNKDENNPKC